VALTLVVVTTDLADRYGSPSAWRRPVTIALAAGLAAIGLTWLGWVAWVHGTPEVRSEIVSFDVISDHEVTARLDVRLSDDDVTATCRLRALSEDKTAVGELAFTPVDGDNDVVIRTERRATSVEKLGCTAEGQSRPR
jgi:Arc/MetJ family transcription regulator